MKTKDELAQEIMDMVETCEPGMHSAVADALGAAEKMGRDSERKVVTDYFAMMLNENRLGQMGQAPQAARNIAAFGSVWRSCSQMWERRSAKADEDLG